MSFRKLLTKWTRPAFYLLGYGCAVHCFGEYVAELVVVCSEGNDIYSITKKSLSLY